MLRRIGATNREGAVVAGAVALVGVNDVKKRLVARANDSISEVVRVRVATLSRDRINRFNLF